HLLPMYAGRMPSLRRGAGHDLFSLRDYQPQDDLRHIDWKATARSRRLTERFERGVVQAASLIKHFIDERAEVRLVLGDEAGPFGSGTDHLYRCLRRL